MNQKIDVYRDTPLRYLGYSNEVGEAFRSIIGSKWVKVSYGVATAYVLADTTSKTKDAFDEDSNSVRRVCFVATDTFVWQMLASVIVPGFAINRVCAFAGYALKYNNSLSKVSKMWTITGIGLIMIPFIIKPIDHLIDDVLDGTLRKYTPID